MSLDHWGPKKGRVSGGTFSSSLAFSQNSAVCNTHTYILTLLLFESAVVAKLIIACTLEKDPRRFALPTAENFIPTDDRFLEFLPDFRRSPQFP